MVEGFGLGDWVSGFGFWVEDLPRIADSDDNRVGSIPDRPSISGSGFQVEG